MNRPLTKIYLSLGSNLGDRINFLEKAIGEISLQIGTPTSRSSFYETEPWGNSNQQNFINCIIEAATSLNPVLIMNAILEIEKNLGRQRNGKWQARTIDIDILFYGNQIISLPGIHVPHVQIQNRRFILEPLSEIAPYYIHPVLNKTTIRLLEECKDSCKVQLYLPG